jgi:hypothetical protein
VLMQNRIDSACMQTQDALDDSGINVVLDDSGAFEIRWWKTTIIVIREIERSRLPSCGLADPVGDPRRNAIVRRVKSLAPLHSGSQRC